eukprot:6203180-Pleurochrysis_carterae.AAC.1
MLDGSTTRECIKLACTSAPKICGSEEIEGRRSVSTVSQLEEGKRAQRGAGGSGDARHIVKLAYADYKDNRGFISKLLDVEDSLEMLPSTSISMIASLVSALGGELDVQGNHTKELGYHEQLRRFC